MKNNYLNYESYKVKRNKKKIVLIIIGVLVLLSLISLAAVKIIGKNMEKSTPPAPKPTKKEVQQEVKEPKDPGKYEMPVVGASGFASVSMDLKAEKDISSKTIKTLKGGDSFCILEEDKTLWKIETADGTGWVDNRYCMINLPDIIPSIIYLNTNSTASVFKSSGKDIPGLTGEKLYNAITMNNRFGTELPLMPVIYSMSDKIYEAQQKALQNNESLVLVESYRPYEIQQKVIKDLSALMKNDPEVSKGINQSPWSQSWFISTGKSNHQRGIAIDVTLAKINGSQDMWAGDYIYKKVTDYQEYTMPSPIHELSVQAVSFAKPFDSGTSQWKNVAPSENMNEEALRLQKYCTDAGLTPLASEWWHFDDPDAKSQIADNKSNGNYYLKDCYSRI